MNLRNIKVGDKVKDIDGHKGIVVKIIESGIDEDNEYFHGVIYVWQLDRIDYGSDNCEHYTYDNWRSFLTFID